MASLELELRVSSHGGLHEKLLLHEEKSGGILARDGGAVHQNVFWDVGHPGRGQYTHHQRSPMNAAGGIADGGQQNSVAHGFDGLGHGVDTAEFDFFFAARVADNSG